MIEQSFLIGLSQLALIFTGFVAIFLIYVRGDGRFSPADSLRIASMIFTGIGLLFAALSPIMFWSLGLAEFQVWQYSALLQVLVGGPTSLFMARRHLKMTAEDRAEVGLIHSAITWSMQLAVSAIFISIALGFGGGGLYIVACMIILALSAINFVTITLQKLL